MAETITSAECVVSKLREAIMTGDLRPGARLNQSVLAARFGISRTPMRTALTALAQSGLVDYESNKGFRVRRHSRDEIRAAFLVRAELEALACTLAAPRLDDTGLRKLRGLLVTGDALLEGDSLRPENLEPYRAMNVAFHGAILDAASNPWLRNALENLFNIPMLSDRVILWEDHAVILRSHDDHHRIIRALGQRDGARASAIMREHVTYSVDYMLETLGTRTDTQGRQAGMFGFDPIIDIFKEENT